MEYAVLRSMRTLAPGLIILAYSDVFWHLSLGESFSFWGLDAAKLILFGYIAGGVYGVTLGEYISARTFRGVDEAIKKSLARLVPSVDARSWKQVAPHFYAIVDKDKSLGIKAQGIFFNGFVATTAHNCVWISILAALVGAWTLSVGANCLLLVISSVTGVASYFAWRAVIRKHIRLSKAQVTVIEQRYLGEFASAVDGGGIGGTSD